MPKLTLAEIAARLADPAFTTWVSGFNGDVAAAFRASETLAQATIIANALALRAPLDLQRRVVEVLAATFGLDPNAGTAERVRLPPLTPSPAAFGGPTGYGPSATIEEQETVLRQFVARIPIDELVERQLSEESPAEIEVREWMSAFAASRGKVPS